MRDYVTHKPRHLITSPASAAKAAVFRHRMSRLKSRPTKTRITTDLRDSQSPEKIQNLVIPSEARNPSLCGQSMREGFLAPLGMTASWPFPQPVQFASHLKPQSYSADTRQFPARRPLSSAE